MKFKDNECVIHTNVKDHVVCVFGGNKKFHLGYFENNTFYAFYKKNNELHRSKINLDSVKVLNVTDLMKGDEETAFSKYSKESFAEYKESLFGKRANYTAAFLTQDSAYLLLQKLKNLVPFEWEKKSHHMTMCLGEPKPEVEPLLKNNYKLKVVGFAKSEELGVCAVKVETDLFTANELKHVTVALDKTNNANASDSNKLVDFVDVEPFYLDVRVDVFLNSKETRYKSKMVLF